MNDFPGKSPRTDPNLADVFDQGKIVLRNSRDTVRAVEILIDHMATLQEMLFWGMVGIACLWAASKLTEGE